MKLTAKAVEAIKEHRERQLQEREALLGLWQDHDLVFPTRLGTPISRHNLVNRSFKLDRFRSLPMSGSAVLVGKTLSDTIRNLFVVLLMTGVGHLVGFRFQDGLLNAITALLLVVAFGYAFSWVAAITALLAGNAESAQNLGMIWVFPLIFASSAFVPVESMHGWLQTIAEINPISLAVDALRALVLGDSSVGGPVWPALAWTVGLIAVFAPLAVRLYRRACKAL